VQDDAVALVLRHPHLASTPQQHSHLTALVQDLPGLIGVDLCQLQSTIIQRPSLARYESPQALAAKVKALMPVFPGGLTVH
jgi:hypothetical protein